MGTLWEVIAFTDQSPVEFPDPHRVVCHLIHHYVCIIKQQRQGLQSVRYEPGTCCIVGKIKAIQEMGTVATVCREWLRPSLLAEPDSTRYSPLECGRMFVIRSRNLRRTRRIKVDRKPSPADDMATTRLRRPLCPVTALGIRSSMTIKPLLEAAKQDQNPQVYPFIVIGLETSIRRTEILTIRHEHVDIQRRVIYIPQAKAGEREQPVTAHLATFLEKYIAILPVPTFKGYRTTCANF
jgi:hypothetical protein